MKCTKITMKKILLLFVVEILILIAYIGGCVKKYQDNYYEETFSYEQIYELSNYGIENGNYIDLTMGPGGQVKIGVQGLELKNGTYVIDILYETHEGARFLMEYEHGRNEYNISGDVWLEDISTNKKVVVNLKEDEEPTKLYFQLPVENSSDNYLLIKEIRITSIFQSYLTKIFYAFVFLCLINVGIYLWWNKENIKISKETRLVVACLLGITFISCIPLFTNYIIDAHDLSFHLARIEGVKHSLLNGDFPSRIQAQWLNNHGYPVSIFYGDLFLYLPAILRIVGISLQNAYKFYIICVNGATAWTAYVCFRRISNNKKAGILGAAVYSLNVYRLSNIYARGAVGEYTAMIFFPIILYGLWYILTQKEGELKKNKNIWIWLAIGYLGVLNSHLISCVMVGLFTIITVLVFIKRVLVKERIILLLKAFVGLVAGGMWFIIPLLEYMTMDFISSDNSNFVRYRQEERGMFWAQFFNISYDVNGGTENVMKGMAGEMPLTLGVSFLVIILVAVIVVIYDYKMIKRWKELLFVLALCLIAMWMCTNTFPFAWLAEVSSLFSMLIKSIQYPWRFLAIVGLMEAWMAVLLVSQVNSDKFKEHYVFLFAVVLAAFLIQDASQLLGQVMEKGYVRHIYEEASLDSMWVSGGEYLYRNANVEDYRDKITNVEDGVEVVSWRREKGNLYVDVVNYAEQEKTLEVPLIFYQGYRAEKVDTKEEVLVNIGQSNRIKLKISPSYQGEVCVRFQEPLGWRMAELVSICIHLFFVVCMVRNRIKENA